MKPFLKWAGGKTQLLPVINENLPPDIEGLKYYVEPFIGAGAVFFNMIRANRFDNYIINDINPRLINVYSIIRDDVEGLINRLDSLKMEYDTYEEQEDKEKMFYRIRSEFNSRKELDVLTATHFIFLNKTCFNGLYRENSKGEYNVPFGKHKSPSIYDEAQLREISGLLNTRNEDGEFKVQIYNTNFTNIGEMVNSHCFVYMDPPYRPVTTGGFNAYNKSGFNDEAQVQLANFYRELDGVGARLMLSNSDPRNLDPEDDFFDKLYNGFEIQRVSASRMINSKGSGRGAITELLITNY